MRYLLLYGGPIGDALVAAHVGRTLAENVPGARLELLTTRENTFVRELSEVLPFIRYRSLAKESLSTWFELVSLLFSRNTMIVYEPVASTMSVWWQLILWCSRLRPGNRELRVQVVGFARPVPRGVRVIMCDYATTSLFDTPKAILEALDIEVRNLPKPTLPGGSPLQGQGPYILFCFFAGGPSRSIVLSHAREILQAARTVYPGYHFVLACGETQRELAHQMIEGVADARVAVQVTAHEVLSLLCGACLVVGTNSGLVLMAAHLRRPLVALTNLSQAKAFGLDFSPETITLAARTECKCDMNDVGACKMKTDEGVFYRCLYFITTEEVLSAMSQKIHVGT